MKSENYHTLDIRPILNAKESPLSTILSAVQSLHEGQGLHLIATLNPIPLVHILEEHGLLHERSMSYPDRWEIFYRPTPKPECLDLRGYEPPEPLRLAMEAVEKLEENKSVEFITPHRPVHLLDLLKDRGFDFATNLYEGESYITTVYKFSDE